MPIFEFGKYNYSEAFSGAFLNQQSYIELLRITDSYFDLNMTRKERKLPCQQHSYMLIARSNGQADAIWKGIGRKVSLNIYAVAYNEKYQVLFGLVQLKHNFTCNQQPHIVLAKANGINNVLVSKVLHDSSTRTQVLPVPHKVHGKIGVILDSGQEIITPDRKQIDGIDVYTTHNVVTRPEVVYTVEQPPPKQGDFLSPDEFRKFAEQPKPQAGQDEVMEITLEKTSSGSGAVATGETYQGETVMKGPRGGKYIMKDGKKKYVPAGKGGEGGSDVVYNINILE